MIQTIVEKNMNIRQTSYSPKTNNNIYMKTLFSISIMAICLLAGYNNAYAQKRQVKKTVVTKKVPTSDEIFKQAINYYHGTDGVFMNRDKAKALFRKAADMGNTTAMLWMYICLKETESGYAEAVKYLRVAAENNNGSAMGALGECYERGKCGLQSDAEQALYWYRLAGERNDSFALRRLAIIYHEGYLDIAVDKVAAFEYMKRAADLGDGIACGLLSLAYEKGDGTVKDERQAVYYAKKGSELGDDDSQYFYGGYLVDGFGGLEKDDKLALSYFMKSAEQGNKFAIAAVAEFHQKGWGGLTPSKEEAKKWYAKASELGSAKASLMIADFCCSDDNERLSWYQKAAEQGDITGQAELAWAHCSGKIANYDTRSGAQELVKLSKTGNPRAVYYFGELLLHGSCGIPKNKKAAKSLFESIKNSDDDKASFCALLTLSQMK